MTDIFQYNSGSLLMALNPDSTRLNLADEDFVDNLSDTFVSAVSTDNGVYGVPMGTAMGGGVLYNIGIYEELGLEVPTTWDEFIANSEAAKEAGYAGVIQSYADTWTSQLFVLGDFFNVLAEDPDWATEYTAGNRKYVDEPGTRRLRAPPGGPGGGHAQRGLRVGDLRRRRAHGRHRRGRALPDADLRHPADGRELPRGGRGRRLLRHARRRRPNGLTAWTPSGLYGAATTEHPEAVKKFFEFVASARGLRRADRGRRRRRTVPRRGLHIPDDVPRSVADMLPYFETEGGSLPALEFLSPIKGPALEQITVEVGSGIRPAADGAALYDEDVIKQAQQLGLEGW